MKKLIWILLPAILFAARPTAAQAPDEEDIVNQIFTASSPYYYPNLLLRYNMGDSTLTSDDYRYLYYGFAFRDEYRPLEPNEDFDRMMLIASGLDIENPAVDQLEALIASGFAAAERDPFNLKLLNLMAYAFGALGEHEKEAAYFDRLNMIIATIESSGDGLSERSPRHILMFDHALDLIAAADLTPGKSRVVSRTAEYVPLIESTTINDRKVKGFYFDFSRIYRQKPEGYVYKRPRTWQFNNLKPRKY